MVMIIVAAEKRIVVVSVLVVTEIFVVRFASFFLNEKIRLLNFTELVTFQILID